MESTKYLEPTAVAQRRRRPEWTSWVSVPSTPKALASSTCEHEPFWSALVKPHSVFLPCSTDVPGPVVDLKTVTVTKKNITLTWSDPQDNGGSDIIGYEVLRKDAKMKLFRQPMETASCRCDVQGLLAGEEYDFRVIARNKYGDGAPADLGPILAQDPKGSPRHFSQWRPSLEGRQETNTHFSVF